MSDQGPYTGQPESGQQPPYAPPPGYAPPQGYAPPPATPVPPAPYQPPAQAPKKRKTWLIVLVAVLVLLCLPTACIGAFGVSAYMSQAKTKEAVLQAETHFDSSTDELKQASELINQYVKTEDAAVAEDAEAKIRATRDELSAARTVIEALDESDGRTAYLSSLDSATEAVDGVETVMATMKVLAQLAGQIERGNTAIQAANTLLDASIDAGNDGDYSKMKTKAKAASARYATAITVYGEAHALEPAAGLDKVVDYAKLRKQQADLSVRMADYGKAGKTSSYNKLVDQQKTLDKKATSTGMPEIVSNPTWFEDRMSEQQEAYEAAGERADQMRATALEAFGITAAE